jgi:hypothetical protein
LNTEDKWRIAKLEGKKPSEKPKVVTEKIAKKENTTKETKVTKTQKKEVEK